KELFVHEGDLVREGEPLFAVETSQIAADGIDVNASMLETLNAQKQLLARNIAGEEQRARSEQQRLTSLISGLRSEISYLEGQIRIQSERLNVAELDVTSGNQLRSKGIMTELEFRRRQLQMLEHKQALAALNQQIAARKNQLTETEYSLQQLPTIM